MPSTFSDFTLFQAWIRVDVTGGGAFVLPVDKLTIQAIPYVHGSDGSTAKKLWNGEYVYRCDGWRHDVTVQYGELPEDHHDTLKNLVMDLHSYQGQARVQILNSDKSTSGRYVDVVADLSADTLQAVFDKRVRGRSATINFKGKSPLPFPKSWLTE